MEWGLALPFVVLFYTLISNRRDRHFDRMAPNGYEWSGTMLYDMILGSGFTLVRRALVSCVWGPGNSWACCSMFVRIQSLAVGKRGILAVCLAD